MIWPRSVLMAAALALLAGCQRDCSFNTVAVYEAPRGGYIARLEGRGWVPAGHDVSHESSGVLTLSARPATAPGSPPPLSMDIALNGNGVHLGNDSPDDVSSPERNARAVSDLLIASGYAVHTDELDELMTAIEGILMGPKGTMMDGQAKVLKVVSVRHD
jgi:hypothetical protein